MGVMKTNGGVESNLPHEPRDLPHEPRDMPHELRDLLVALTSKWGDVIEVSEFKVEHLKGAMTNEVYRVSWTKENGEISRNVLVRLYGKGLDLFFDRDEEIQTFEFISSLGFGPDLLVKSSMGRVEEFIHARTLSADDLRDPEISGLIAAKTREFHQLNMPGSRNVVLWDRLRTWLSRAKRVCTMEDREQFRLDEFDDEISRLENEFPGEQKIGFCHNDLQYGNIMIDDETKSLTLIDYEYASYNPVAYDFANHFCEMAANYHTETPHVLDYSAYPGLDERHRFIHAYLSTEGNEPNESEVKKLSEEAEKYTLANHILWGLWGIMSSHVNTLDYDYKEYARQRFEQYWLKKTQVLGD